MMKLEHNGFHANFNPIGAYLEDLQKDGIPIIRKSRDKNSTHGGAAVLFPFGNRIQNAEYTFNNTQYSLPENDGKNSIHGLVRELAFDSNSGENFIEFSSHFKSMFYPGEAYIKVKYEITGNMFVTSFYVKSLTSRIPVEIGFHPYFNVHGSYSISYNSRMKKFNYRDMYFPDGSTVDVDYNGKELNKMPLDNCFYLDSTVILKDEKHSIRMARKNMPYLVLYNGQYAGNDSIAVEPMTGIPDVYHNMVGLVTLEKNAEFVCSYSIEII